jgi:hypothetical protein
LKSTVTNRLQLALCFTSAAVLVPKVASAQTDANISNLDSDSKSQLPLTTASDTTVGSLKDTLIAIVEPELESYFEAFFPISIQQTKVTNLEQKTGNSSSCTPDRVGQPEFAKVVDLEKKIDNLPSCTPDRVGQPEFTNVAELQTKQISPTSHSPKNLPVVAEVDKQSPGENSQIDPKYIIPPRIAPNKKVRPFTTTLPLNNTSINHLTERELFLGSSFGDAQNITFNVNGIVKLNSQVEESLTRNNILTIKQTGSYLQFQTIRKSREVTVSTKEPQTLFGAEIQLSLTASCLFPGSNPENICTYTPGVATDRNSIDPDSLIPTRISQTSQAGNVVTSESLAAMREPGFQKGANGQESGVDLFFPNVGATSGNSQGDKISVTRKEEIQNTPTAIYSTVSQIVKANDREAVIGRTVRGFGFILNDENTLFNSALQVANILLPDAVPQITGGSNKVNGNVNNNLFYAANNARLPANSFTFYHGGIGRAKSLQAGVTNLNQVTAASFNGIWLGVSPVIKRSFFSKTRYEPIGPRNVAFAGGGEGGIDSNVSVLSIINGESFSPATLKNFYAQVYLKNFNQEVNYLTSVKQLEETSYVPHISFTGDITGTENVFRYYAGAIGVEDIKAYIGGDFTRNTLSGWTFSGSAIAYLNSDRDYYSQVQGSVAKRIPLGRNANLIFSTALNYAIDREAPKNDFVNSLTVGARANMGDVSVGLVNYFADILPGSVDNTLLLDLSIKLGQNFRLSGYYTPINESSSRSRYGTNAEFKLGNKYNSPTLTFSWTNSEYKFGQDSSGNELGVNNNTFGVLLRSNL